MLDLNDYMLELVAEVDLDIDTDDIYYLAPPPVTIPQLKKGVAFMYGGTQFGDYQDLGDGRSCMAADMGVGGVVIAKGCLTTPFTKFGDGNYYLEDAESCLETQLKLKELKINVEKTFAIYRVGTSGATAIIQRACPYRIGTFEYVSRHHPEKIEKLFIALLVNYSRHHGWVVLSMLNDYFKEIIVGYGEQFQKWHNAGFVHGCLNTDNMSALPEVIDVQHSFFSFNDTAHSEIDVNGRYSRENQENAVLFGLNRYRLALQSLFPDYTADNMHQDFCKGKNNVS